MKIFIPENGYFVPYRYFIPPEVGMSLKFCDFGKLCDIRIVEIVFACGEYINKGIVEYK